jgi:hypothetical protein
VAPAVVAACAPAATALAQTPPPGEPSIASTAVSPLTIPFDPSQPLIRCAATEQGCRNARLTVAVQNQGTARVSLSVRYLPTNGSEPFDVKPVATPRQVVGLAPKSSASLDPQEVGQVVIQFALPAATDPSAADGLVVITAVRGDGDAGAAAAKAAPALIQQVPVPAPPAPAPPTQAPPAPAPDAKPAPLIVPVAGSFVSPAGVSVEPTSLQMQITKFLPGLADGKTVRVELRGAAARTLIGRSTVLDGSAHLQGPDGGADVHWTVDDGELGVEVEGEPDPGTYKGTLPLFADAADQNVELTIQSHHWWFWPFLVVLLGSLVGGLLPLLARRARRRSLLLEELEEVLRGYFKQRGDRSEAPVSYSIDDYLGPVDEPWKEVRYFAVPESLGAPGLFSKIRFAANDEDLDEAAKWARELEDKVRTWTAIERQAFVLDQVLTRQPPPLADRQWHDLKLVRDSEIVLAEAHEPPASADAADKLAARIADQRQWHTAVLETWTKLSALSGSSPRSRDLIARLAGIAPSCGAGDPDTAAPPTAATRAELHRLRRDIDQAVAEHRRFLTLGRTDALAQTFARGIFDQVLDRSSLKLDIPARIRAIRRADAALTALTALAAVAGYILLKYDGDYGTGKDYAAAFLVGFGAEAVVKWAGMPIFESLRTRIAGDAGATEKKKKEPEEASAAAAAPGGSR